MKYRSRTDIINGILQAVKGGGTTKTRIMYGAFLSYAQVQEYLAFMVAKGLLAFDQASGVYTQTQQSLGFLHAYDEIREWCEIGPEDADRVMKNPEAPIAALKSNKAEMDSRARIF